MLAQRFERAAHVEADGLQELIVAGGRWPDQAPREQALAQLELRARNAALLAANFHDAGIVAVIDDVMSAATGWRSTGGTSGSGRWC